METELGFEVCKAAIARLQTMLANGESIYTIKPAVRAQLIQMGLDQLRIRKEEIAADHARTRAMVDNAITAIEDLQASGEFVADGPPAPIVDAAVIGNIELSKTLSDGLAPCGDNCGCMPDITPRPQGAGDHTGPDVA